MTDAASNALLSAFTAFWSPPASPAGRAFPGADVTTTAEPFPSLFASPRGAAAAVAAALYGFGMQPAAEPAAPVPVWSRLTKRRAPMSEAACGASEAHLAAIRATPEGTAWHNSAAAPASRKGRKDAGASLARAAAPSRVVPAAAAPKLGKRKAGAQRMSAV